MSNKALKTFATWGILIALFIYLIENLTTILPLLIISSIAYLALKGLKKPRRK
jgi:hypothetical protein